MKILSNGSAYGLRALLYLAAKGDTREFVSIGEISEQLDISFHFLTKVLQSLSQKDILVSYRGPNGGVALARAPETIRLSEVVLILEGEDYFEKCLLGLPGCGDQAPCPMHYRWKHWKASIRSEFESTTLADLKEPELLKHLRWAT
ncbi:MAG: Rrf2 family transcriptional regulator [Saprospiraceae bacterium]|nr:Rrf2 family transcriptional regulator [Saprospiraceae bacterium]MCB0622384.1 Rrf2 family transcriptional regulator [Saprospiraceae bacterium]MCB0676773.1 Rrf2 family transcriptional regulator [Saprospiraceae bacterium]MCB0682400.1 Rrf2 family transcriptional regulator [Saprospiraceae bacterium]